MNRVGELLRHARMRLGWRFGEIARKCGAATPREISKLSQRLVRLERADDVPEPRLAIRVAALLGVATGEVVRLIDEQRKEEKLRREAWLNEAVPIELHVLPFGGFAFRYRLPGGCDDLEAFRLAKQMTSGREQMRVVVALNRRLSFVFQRGQLIDRLEAAPGRNVPVMQIGRSLAQFNAAE